MLVERSKTPQFIAHFPFRCSQTFSVKVAYQGELIAKDPTQGEDINAARFQRRQCCPSGLCPDFQKAVQPPDSVDDAMPNFFAFQPLG